MLTNICNEGKENPGIGVLMMMPRLKLLIGLWALMGGIVSAADVTTIRQTWHDAARSRDVPVLIYLPAGTAAEPAIVFSHGLGGSRDGYRYLGKYWAEHGFASVHLQHLGSDTAVWAEAKGNPMTALRAAAANPLNAINRCKDVSFAIDQLTALNADPHSPLHGRIDIHHLGMAGHSFGAYTTMAIAGRSAVGAGKSISLADPRILAAVAMSEPAVKNPANATAAYDPVHIPVFELTGTKDDSPIGETRAADRRIGFDHLVHAPAYLAIFNGGDHMLFSGRERFGRAFPNDDRDHTLIQQTTTEFFDAYLRNDAAAQAKFQNGGIAKELGDAASFEAKPGTR